MGKLTGISWTDHTFNPWWGCTKVSAGCDNCYADSFDRRTGGAHWGKGAPRREFGDKHWNEPLRWNSDAEREGRKHLVFCASMADVMDDEAPAGARERLWQLIDATPWLTWQLLTKRPHRYERYLPGSFKHDNVWLGTTTENQDAYNVRWPILAKVCDERNLRSWISYEPALGPLTLTDFPIWPTWVICGGESGPKARPMNPNWAWDVQRQCEAAGVAFFFKQWGEWVAAGHPEFGRLPKGHVMHIREDGTPWPADAPPPDENADVLTMKRVGKARAGRELYTGREFSEYPERP